MSTEKAAYQKQVFAAFEVNGVGYRLIEWDPDHVWLEETRKNGQEDTHMGGEADLVEGVWSWQWETISDCFSEKQAASVLAYIQTYGIPNFSGEPSNG